MDNGIKKIDQFPWIEMLREVADGNLLFGWEVSICSNSMPTVKNKTKIAAKDPLHLLFISKNNTRRQGHPMCLAHLAHIT